MARLAGRIPPQVASALRLERPAHDLSLEAWLARVSELERLWKAFEAP